MDLILMTNYRQYYDNITSFDHPRKNRFRKSKRRHPTNLRKLLYREKERKTIEEAKKT